MKSVGQRINPTDFTDLHRFKVLGDSNHKWLIVFDIYNYLIISHLFAYLNYFSYLCRQIETIENSKYEQNKGACMGYS